MTKQPKSVHLQMTESLLSIQHSMKMRNFNFNTDIHSNWGILTSLIVAIHRADIESIECVHVKRVRTSYKTKWSSRRKKMRRRRSKKKRKRWVTSFNLGSNWGPGRCREFSIDASVLGLKSDVYYISSVIFIVVLLQFIRLLLLLFRVIG